MIVDVVDGRTERTSTLMAVRRLERVGHQRIGREECLLVECQIAVGTSDGEEERWVDNI